MAGRAAPAERNVQGRPAPRLRRPDLPCRTRNPPRLCPSMDQPGGHCPPKGSCLPTACRGRCEAAPASREDLLCRGHFAVATAGRVLPRAACRGHQEAGRALSRMRNRQPLRARARSCRAYSTRRAEQRSRRRATGRERKGSCRLASPFVPTWQGANMHAGTTCDVSVMQGLTHVTADMQDDIRRVCQAGTLACFCYAGQRATCLSCRDLRTLML